MTSDTFKRLIDLLIKEEGYRRMPYLDTKGKLTVGIGMNLESGNYSKAEIAAYKLNGISLQAAKEECADEIYHLDLQLRRSPIYNTLNDIRQAIIVDMSFNMGMDKVFRFAQMWNALSNHNYVEAAKQMLWNDNGSKTDYYVDVKKRADNLARMMSTGEW